jgi:hypothetical protein
LPFEQRAQHEKICKQNPGNSSRKVPSNVAPQASLIEAAAPLAVDLSRDVVAEFRTYMGKTHLRPSTIDKYVRAYKRYFAFQVKSDSTFHPSQLLILNPPGMSLPRLPVVSAYIADAEVATATLHEDLNAVKKFVDFAQTILSQMQRDMEAMRYLMICNTLTQIEKECNIADKRLKKETCAKVRTVQSKD